MNIKWLIPDEHQTTVMPIKLREYQKELVEVLYICDYPLHDRLQKANLGENTVIVAPTGCGKTVVAAQIMRHHVMTSLAKKKPYRVRHNSILTFMLTHILLLAITFD